MEERIFILCRLFENFIGYFENGNSLSLSSTENEDEDRKRNSLSLSRTVISLLS